MTFIMFTNLINVDLPCSKTCFACVERTSSKKNGSAVLVTMDRKQSSRWVVKEWSRRQSLLPTFLLLVKGTGDANKIYYHLDNKYMSASLARAECCRNCFPSAKAHHSIGNAFFQMRWRVLAITSLGIFLILSALYLSAAGIPQAEYSICKCS